MPIFFLRGARLHAYHPRFPEQPSLQQPADTGMWAKLVLAFVDIQEAT